jgi:hypothetical protein
MTIENLADKLLKTKTGASFLDSGDVYGRHWQSNQDKDFNEEPTAWADLYDGEEIYPTASLYHWLISRFEVDALCDEFNSMPVNDWNSDKAYGLSEAGEEWLLNHGFEIGDSFNSYNGVCDLSQTIQGAWLNDFYGEYMLLQVHQGCDVRGGYTDAILLKKIDPDYINVSGNVMGVLERDGDKIRVDNMHNGYSLTDESGDEIVYQNGDKLDLWLPEF